MKKLFLSLIAALTILNHTAHAEMGVVQLETREDVKQAFAQHKPMVIMMHATWCPACKATVPNYLKAAQKLKGVTFYMMDVDKMQLMMKKPVQYIPSFVAGTEELTIRNAGSLESGAMSEKEILQYVRKNTGVK